MVRHRGDDQDLTAAVRFRAMSPVTNDALIASSLDVVRPHETEGHVGK